MSGAVVTGAFVMAASAHSICCCRRHEEYGRIFLRVGRCRGLVASALLQLFPTGDVQGKNVAQHQPVTLAAMEALFEAQTGAPIVIPRPTGCGTAADRQSARRSPNVLSFLTYGTGRRRCKGSNAFPEDQWPTTSRCSTTAIT